LINKTLITVGCLWMSAQVAMAACAPLPTNLRYDKPAVQDASCAFKNAAENDVNGYFKANASIDLGHGQVGQKLQRSQAQCGGASEVLIVLNCNAGKSLALAGAVDPVFGKKSPVLIGPAPSSSISNIQPPHGPISLGQGTSISKLSAIAKKHRIGEYKSLNALRIGTRSRNSVDFWCGCKRFYPSSAGAKL
jgi:hypothetical protein